MTDRTRRALLSTVGCSALAAAGCLGTPAPERVEVGESVAETVVDDVWFQVSFLYRYGAHVEVKAVADAQFVFAHVSPERPRSEFSFVVDGDEYPARNELRSVAVSGIRFDDAHSYDTGRLLAFELPRQPDASSAHVAWTSRDAVWTIDDEAVERLNAPPSFEVDTVSAPESVAAGSEFMVSASIRNTGGRKDVFLASAGLSTRSDPPEIRVEVPAGGRTQWKRTYQAPPETGTIEFSLSWVLDSVTKSIRVE